VADSADTEESAPAVCSFGSCAFNRQCVPGDGPLPASLVVIGEAPGPVELREGRPFVGPAGRLLDALLSKCGLARHSARVMNTCGCVALDREDRRPLPAELAACEPRLKLELALAHPKVVVCVGNTAIQRWFPGMRIGQVYNRVRAVEDGYVVIPTYHPAHVLRGNKQVEPVIEAAFRIARSWLKEE